METTTYKKANFKVGGQVAYERYMFGEFVGYSYKERKYQLVMDRLSDGSVKWKEKFVAWGYGHFSRVRKEDGTYLSWEEWADFHRNFVNEVA